MSLFVKDAFKILVEAATDDLAADTAEQLENDQIISTYNDLDECGDTYSVTAEMVAVVKIGDEYFTEMNYLAPYMQDANIKSVVEAINNVAKANGLNEGDVGLLVDSQDSIDEMIEVAVAKGGKAKANTLAKLAKAENLFGKLKSSGVAVKKKKSNKK